VRFIPPSTRGQSRLRQEYFSLQRLIQTPRRHMQYFGDIRTHKRPRSSSTTPIRPWRSPS
jgi:hypothetical protein